MIIIINSNHPEHRFPVPAIGVFPQNVQLLPSLADLQGRTLLADLKACYNGFQERDCQRSYIPQLLLLEVLLAVTGQDRISMTTKSKREGIMTMTTRGKMPPIIIDIVNGGVIGVCYQYHNHYYLNCYLHLAHSSPVPAIRGMPWIGQLLPS